jgi:hypothetical protein
MMDLLHRHGWRISPLPGSAHQRLSLHRIWLGDHLPAGLIQELGRYELDLCDFAPDSCAPCQTVDVTTRTVCLRQPAVDVPVPGGGRRLCGPCQEALAQLADSHLRVDAADEPDTTFTDLDRLWLTLGDDRVRPVSYELREGVAKILGFAELLTDCAPPVDERQYAMLHTIHRAARRVQEVLAESAWAI